MNNIKVGEYIRTKHGVIGKYVEKDEEGRYLLKCKIDFVLCSVTEEKIVKHSKNLIDLIEEGDYVNNCRVVEHAYQKGRLFVTYLYIGGKVITTTEDYSWELTKDREDLIHSIVTKEQFENISYKVENGQ